MNGHVSEFVAKLKSNPKVTNLDEVKKAGEGLDNHQEQLLDYSFR